MNLFLTEDGVVKLGYYGLTTQTECYSLKIMKCDGLRSFAPEVSRKQYEVISDMWYLGEFPFENDAIESSDLVDFLHNCFAVRLPEEWGVNELMDVSGME